MRSRRLPPILVKLFDITKYTCRLWRIFKQTEEKKRESIASRNLCMSLYCRMIDRSTEPINYKIDAHLYIKSLPTILALSQITVYLTTFPSHRLLQTGGWTFEFRYSKRYCLKKGVSICIKPFITTLSYNSLYYFYLPMGNTKQLCYNITA